MTQAQLLALIEAWNPETSDLPEEVALAMDEDPVLLAAFEARFPPVPLGDVAVPAGLEARVMPTELVPAPANRRRWLLPLALAASALIAVGSVTLTVSRPLSPVAEAERAATQVEDRGKTTQGSSALNTLGYVDDEDGLSDAEKKSLLNLGYWAPQREKENDSWQEGRAKPKEQGYAAREFKPDEAPVVRNLSRGPARGDVAGAQVDVLRGDNRAPQIVGGTPAESANQGFLPRLRLPTDPDPTSPDQFVDPGTNGRFFTSQAPVTTFSVDVDRASYTYARRVLRAGQMPTPASVRTEEFVNALTYDGPVPTDGPLGVTAELSPSPFDPSMQLVRLVVRSRPVAQRQPVHLVFLVDTSGSMQGPDRLPLVQQSLSMLVDQLGPGDTVALVTYAGSAGVVLTPTGNKPHLLEAIRRLQSGGSTAMGAGIEAAYALAAQRHQPGHTSRVILASDGDANVGVTDTAALSAMIRRYASQGISLTTLGFGDGNLADHRMEQLADDGDGQYLYIDGMEEARHVFVDTLASTLEVVARDVKVQVAWNPEAVVTYRQLGYENRALQNRDFRDDRIDAGEVGAGHVVTAIYEVQLGGVADLLGTIRLRYKPPGPDAPSTEAAWSLGRDAIVPSFAASSADHRMAVIAGAFAEKLRHSPFAPTLSYAELAGMASASARPGHPEDGELRELIGRAQGW
jgi:Ca-activated chloride channel family protein